MATHLGVIDEDKINNMSYVFFEEILEELGRKLNYDAVVNYAGNSFCEKSWEMIMDSNPMTMNEHGTISRRQKDLESFLGGARVATPADIEKMKGIKGNGKAEV